MGARVHETVPRSRTTLAWLIKRGFRKGACNTRIDRKYAAGFANQHGRVEDLRAGGEIVWLRLDSGRLVKISAEECEAVEKKD